MWEWSLFMKRAFEVHTLAAGDLTNQR